MEDKYCDGSTNVFPFILTAAGSELNLWSLECAGVVETRVVKNFD